MSKKRKRHDEPVPLEDVTFLQRKVTPKPATPEELLMADVDAEIARAREEILDLIKAGALPQEALPEALAAIEALVREIHELGNKASPSPLVDLLRQRARRKLNG